MLQKTKPTKIINFYIKNKKLKILIFLMIGANLLYVKELLGHSNIDTTQVYTHLSSEFVRDGFHKSAKGPAR